MSSPATDAELLAAHVAGDPAAFGELFARHRDRLWAVALRTMGNPEDAADGLQDAMVAAFRRAGSFRGDSAVTTWLHRVVVNACLDRMRAARVRAADPLPDDVDRHRPTGDPTRGPGASAEPDDPADVAVAHDRRDRVLAALGRLPEEQRAALVLVDLEGWSVAEAAAALDCAEGTVKSRCSRGRARLAELLRDLLPAVEGGGPGTPAGAPGNRDDPRAVPPRGAHPPTGRSARPARPRRPGEEVGG